MKRLDTPVTTNWSRIREGINLIMAINKGDKLSSVEVWKATATRQYLKKNLKEGNLRELFLNKGVAHAFYKKHLWAAPVSGHRIQELNFCKLTSINLDAKKEEIEGFLSDELWYPVSIVLLKDAIKYALRAKLKNNKNLISKGLEVFDKGKIVCSRISTYVILGISFKNILRVGRDNICICPRIVYECYDSLNRRVEDPSERQINILRASKCDATEYINRLSSIIDEIFPLQVYLSNRTLKFDSIYYSIGEKSGMEVGENGCDR
jgi:hypothetical protein